MAYVFEEVGTMPEWRAICARWKKPNQKPTRDISTFGKDELASKVVCVYKLNASKPDRDIGLIKPAGASTPMPNQYIWVSGINTVC